MATIFPCWVLAKELEWKQSGIVYASSRWILWNMPILTIAIRSTKVSSFWWMPLDGAYIFMIQKNETNLKYLYKMMVEKEPFYVKQLESLMT